MADFWVDLKKMPVTELGVLEDLTGISEIRDRIAFQVIVELEGVEQPLSGTLLTLPADPSPVINGILIRSGTYFTSRRQDEVDRIRGLCRSPEYPPETLRGICHHPLSLQPSNLSLSGELSGLATISFFMPTIFMLVAVPVLNVLMNRLAQQQLKHQLAGARAGRELAARRLARATLKSPVDGIVLRRLVKNEAYLGAGTLLLEIGVMKNLRVTADILSQDVVTVRQGNPAEIYGPSIGSTPVIGTVNHDQALAQVAVSTRRFIQKSPGGRDLSHGCERRGRQRIIFHCFRKSNFVIKDRSPF